MPASIGHPKAGGRGKGTPNKITADIRERITAIIDDNYLQVAKDIASLPPERRVETWIKLLDFVTPRMQRSEVKNDFGKFPFPNGFNIGYGDEIEMPVITIQRDDDSSLNNG